MNVIVAVVENLQQIAEQGRKTSSGQGADFNLSERVYRANETFR
jgi:hypothetical protein